MRLLREASCCFTGHRRVPKSEERVLLLKLAGEIRRLHEEEGIDFFLAGGALGFDTLAAREVLNYRESEPSSVRLILVLPCLGQDSGWSEADSRIYQDFIRRADEVIYTGDIYSQACMHIRNRYLVKHSSVCLCYLKGNRYRSGTGNTVAMARKEGLEVINLAPDIAGSSRQAREI